MGYRALVQNNVDKAFRLIGDLTTSVKLVRKSKSTFNFETLEAKNVEMADLVTLAVITEARKPTAEHNARATSMMLKTRDIGDINLFDSVIVGTDTFKIGPVISTDGYITNVEVFKEG